MTRERRPTDDQYYETRFAEFSQGDIFRDVPLSYPLPANEISVEDGGEGSRAFLSGPLSFGMAMLITPTCSMRAQGTSGYAHPIRTLVPVLPLDDSLREGAGITDEKLGLCRSYDGLINYMYLPADPSGELPESLALLYMPITLHHDFLDGQRITQLAVEGARQLHRKLQWFFTSVLDPREAFSPPLD